MSKISPTIKIYEELCISCKDCIKVCPLGVFEEKEGRVIVAHGNRCNLCHACEDSCLSVAIDIKCS